MEEERSVAVSPVVAKQQQLVEMQLDALRQTQVQQKMDDALDATVGPGESRPKEAAVHAVKESSFKERFENDNSILLNSHMLQQDQLLPEQKQEPAQLQHGSSNANSGCSDDKVNGAAGRLTAEDRKDEIPITDAIAAQRTLVRRFFEQRLSAPGPTRAPTVGLDVAVAAASASLAQYYEYYIKSHPEVAPHLAGRYHEIANLLSPDSLAAVEGFGASNTEQQPPPKGAASTASVETEVAAAWAAVAQNLSNESIRLDFPLVRVKRIVRAAADVSLISGETATIFARLAQLFVGELAHRAWAEAQHEKRVVVLHKDIKTAITRTCDLDFLVEVVKDVDMVDEKKEETGSNVHGVEDPVVKHEDLNEQKEWGNDEEKLRKTVLSTDPMEVDERDAQIVDKKDAQLVDEKDPIVDAVSDKQA